MKTKNILVGFVLLEALDAVLTGFGIYSRGLSFEKNLFIRSLIESYGFLLVSFLKVALSLAIAYSIFTLNEKFKKQKKFLFYFSILLCLIAGYGVFSSIYALSL